MLPFLDSVRVSLEDPTAGHIGQSLIDEDAVGAYVSSYLKGVRRLPFHKRPAKGYCWTEFVGLNAPVAAAEFIFRAYAQTLP